MFLHSLLIVFLPTSCSLQVKQPKEKEKNKGQKKASTRAKNTEAHEMDNLAAGFLEGVAEWVTQTQKC